MVTAHPPAPVHQDSILKLGFTAFAVQRIINRIIVFTANSATCSLMVTYSELMYRDCKSVETRVGASKVIRSTTESHLPAVNFISLNDHYWLSQTDDRICRTVLKEGFDGF